MLTRPLSFTFMVFTKELERIASAVERRLEALLDGGWGEPTGLDAAMRYAVLGGGKRIRPFLLLSSARLFGAKLTEAWGQQIIVDNRGGAGTTIGTAIAARAVPDGYTVLLSSIATHAIAPNLYAKPGYDR